MELKFLNVCVWLSLCIGIYKQIYFFVFPLSFSYLPFIHLHSYTHTSWDTRTTLFRKFSQLLYCCPRAYIFCAQQNRHRKKIEQLRFRTKKKHLKIEKRVTSTNRSSFWFLCLWIYEMYLILMLLQLACSVDCARYNILPPFSLLFAPCISIPCVCSCVCVLPCALFIVIWLLLYMQHDESCKHSTHTWSTTQNRIHESLRVSHCATIAVK